MRRALLVAALLYSASASAYVRSRTTSGTATMWTSSCVIMQPDSAATTDMPSASVFSTIQASMQAWRGAVQSCSYMVLDYVAPAALEVKLDGINIVKFRPDKWCYGGSTATDAVCYSSVAAGITTVFFADHPNGSDDGHILDADIELNDVNFTFAVVDPNAPQDSTPRSGTQLADLENTLVHEMGHVQGLDHTCSGSSTPKNEVDDTGSFPPDCDALGALPVAEQQKIESATMFASATPGETKKRTPEPDDIAAICVAYPEASNPGTCEPADISGYNGKGCSASIGGVPASGSALLCVYLLAIVLRRRRALR